MDTSTDPVSPDHSEEAVLAAAPIENVTPWIDGQRDLYAESELLMRHERTERMIRRAQEQV